MNKTCLFSRHVELKAKMAPYAGFDMPIEYEGLIEEHSSVRLRTGLFDVSHMGEILLKGNRAYEFVNQLVTNFVPSDKFTKAFYCLMLNKSGTIIDDLFVYPLGPEMILLVVNASNVEKDFRWVHKHAMCFQVEATNVSDDYGQLALQGPLSEEVLTPILGTEISTLRFMEFKNIDFLGKKILVSRSGYTGEDGFELYSDQETTVKLWDALLSNSKVKPCGLGARDTLRFEAALSLYGHEIDETVTPLQANLLFAVKFDKEFIGRDALLKEKKNGPKRFLVGLEVTGRGIARATYPVLKGEVTIGYVTTGYSLPGHDRPIALALISSHFAQIGTEVLIQVRSTPVSAVVRDTIFMKKNYKKS